LLSRGQRPYLLAQILSRSWPPHATGYRVDGANHNGATAVVLADVELDVLAGSNHVPGRRTGRAWDIGPAARDRPHGWVGAMGAAAWDASQVRLPLGHQVMVASTSGAGVTMAGEGHTRTGDPVPWQVGTSGCGAHSTTGVAGTPRRGGARVTHAGLRVGGQPLEAWPAFACPAHAAELVAPRELLDRDRALLADWADRERRALAGEGWDPPTPLAVGSAARELERRAVRAALLRDPSRTDLTSR
jgi:hypothetical protein